MIIEEMGGQQRGWQCVAEGAAEDNRGEGSGSEGDATGGKERPVRRGGKGARRKHGGKYGKGWSVSSVGICTYHGTQTTQRPSMTHKANIKHADNREPSHHCLGSVESIGSTLCPSPLPPLSLRPAPSPAFYFPPFISPLRTCKMRRSSWWAFPDWS